MQSRPIALNYPDRKPIFFPSNTLGAQTKRESDKGCVVKRTYDPKRGKSIKLVHSLAQSTAETALPCLGKGTGLESAETITITLIALGGNLEMLRDGTWTAYARTMVWLFFDALKVVHRVTTVTEATRYTVTLYTPGQLALDSTRLGQSG